MFAPSLRIFALMVLGAPLLAQPFAPNTTATVSSASHREWVFNPAFQPFYHGVASGDPTPTSVILWTRVTESLSGDVELDWYVSPDTAFSVITAQGAVVTGAASDYTAKVLVSGLAPGSTYYYRFRSGAKYSLTGRAHTLPEGPTDHLRFGMVSCSNYEGGFFNAYAHLAARNDLAAVVHLGDYIYEYGINIYGSNLPGRTHQPEHELLSLTDYRTRYSLHRLDPDLIRLHQQHTFINVWDDHESANDSYTDGAQNHQPSEGDWEVRKATARQAYFEWMPIAGSPEQPIYRRFKYGDLCDLLMLDTRLEGRDAPPANFDDPDVPPRQMISPTQMDWLTQRLAAPDTRWKLVGNQVLFSTFNVGFGAGALDGNPDFTNIDSIRQVENAFIDNWESYPGQRNSIIDTLQHQAIDNVVIISGDSHCSWAFDVTKEAVKYPLASQLYLPTANPYQPATGEGYDKLTGAGSYAVEFGVPSVSSPNFDEIFPAELATILEGYLNAPIPPFNLEYNPHLKYVDLDRHGYVLLDVRPDTVQADYYYVPTQLMHSDSAYFGQAALTVNGQNHVQLSTLPSSPAAVQDVPTPELPWGVTTDAVTLPSDAAVLWLSAWPNPAKEVLYIQIALNQSQEVRITVADISGRIVLAPPKATLREGMAIYRMDTGALPAGQYVMTLAYPGGQHSALIWKQE